MYKRDIAVLFLSGFAVYFALQNESNFTFRKAWYSPLPEAEEVLYETSNLPLPLVIDLNGDGNLELVVATHDFKIQVLKPRGVGRDGDGFAVATVMAEVSLLPEKLRLTAGRRPVAFQAGFIDPPLRELARKARKAVLVVVTADFHVFCFDHNLKTMWETDIYDTIPHHAVIEEVGISISNHTIYTNDRGLIVIGGSIHLGASIDEEEEMGAAHGFEDEDPLEVDRKQEEKISERARSVGDAKAKLENINFGSLNENDVDLSRHFSYFAFEGGQGHSRWVHEGTSFHRDMAKLQKELIPQNNYRIDAEALDARHYGEVSCREYRESILHNLPHQWNSRSDTKLHLSHFVKHKSGKGAKKKSLAQQGEKPGVSGTSKTGAQVSAVLNHGVGKVDKDGKAAHQHIKDPIATLPPNAIVAHLKEGIEAIHLYSGKQLCKLHLPEGGLHVDLNGDGVVDHVQATAGSHVEYHSDTGHRRVPGCHAYAYSGIPPMQHLFNGSICRGGFFQPFLSEDGGVERSMRNIEVANPVMLPVPTPTGEYRFQYGQRGYAVFLTNRGLITAFGSRGDKKWQVSTDCRWRNEGHRKYFSPTLKPLPIRTHALPSTILAAGRRHCEILSEHGKVLFSMDLAEGPMEELQILDFNGDGLNDIVLIGRKNIYGYAQIQHPGGVPFSVLLLGLIVAMGVVFMTQAGAQSRRPGQPMKRSTDRVD